MVYLNDRDFFIEVQRGKLTGYSMVHKFGRNPDIDTTTDPEDVWNTGGTINWQTTADTIDIVSSSTDDDGDPAGNGAHKLYIQGLDGSFNLQEETITLDGTSTASSSNTYIRLFRAYVPEQGAGFHGANVGSLTCTYQLSGDTALTVGAGAGQSEYAAYTIPNGKTGYLVSANINVAGAVQASFGHVILYHCPNADDVVTPYTGAKRVVLNFDGVTGNIHFVPRSPIKFVEKTDLWWTVQEVSASNTGCSVNFEILLIDN